jgi:lysophospholipase L1-like esterase
MFKRLIFATVTSLFLLSSIDSNLVLAGDTSYSGYNTASNITTTDNSNNTNQSYTITDQILAGLWAGSNGDFTDTKEYLGQVNQPTNSSNNSTSIYSANVQRVNNTYAALGDSVAAGAGLPAVGLSSQEQICGRSSQAYPYLVAQATGLPLQHVACTGAKMGDLTTQQRTPGSNPIAQLDTAYSTGTPSLITITAGANDVQWAGFMRYCYTNDCYNTVTSTLFNSYLSLMGSKLKAALTDIQNRSGSHPPLVIFTGYYFPISSSCLAVQQGITSSEINLLATATSAINGTLQDIGYDYSFFHYVPLDFRGHDVCSNSSWVQDLNSAAPLHPNAAGQQAIATRIINTIIAYDHSQQ